MSKRIPKIPKSLVVLGTKYVIKQLPEIVWDGNNCEGLADIDNKVIYLRKDLSPIEKWKTFLHECFHALVKENGTWQCVDENTEQVLAETASLFYFQIIESFFN